MMKKENMKKKSTARKLLPAAGMLAVSASMLATSTYAWFTMNKEVEVKGLKMQATASSGLEISLGAWGTQNGTKENNLASPTKDDVSWKRSILISDYYATVGMLKPASTDTALSVYKVDETKIYAGGHAVENNATISLANQGDSAAMTLKATGGDAVALATSNDASDAGYYIDIPMWIRSSNQTAGGTNVYATVTITDPNSANGSELIKAARVAIIPVGEADAEGDGAITNSYASKSYGASSDTASTIAALGTNPYGSTVAANIFGLEAAVNDATASMDSGLSGTALSWPTYHGKVIKAAGAYDAGGSSTTLGATTVNAARGAAATQVNATNVFTIPAATADDYGRVGFVARVWLEGESIYCEDATANQDWNIDFYFSTDSTQQAAYVAP